MTPLGLVRFCPVRQAVSASVLQGGIPTMGGSGRPPARRRATWRSRSPSCGGTPAVTASELTAGGMVRTLRRPVLSLVGAFLLTPGTPEWVHDGGLAGWSANHFRTSRMASAWSWRSCRPSGPSTRTSSIRTRGGGVRGRPTGRRGLVGRIPRHGRVRPAVGLLDIAGVCRRGVDLVHPVLRMSVVWCASRRGCPAAATPDLRSPCGAGTPPVLRSRRPPR
jgi:hypothetical protein